MTAAIAHCLSGKTVLVTGANGFLACAVARRLPAGWTTIALIRAGSAPPAGPYGRVYASAEALLADVPKLDVVLHLAARIPNQLEPRPGDLNVVNLELPARLADAYPAARHVLASSVSIYGVPLELPITVDTPPRQACAYGQSKQAAEQRLQNLPHRAIIRFSSIIGPRMKGGSFIPAAVEAARKGRITLFGSGQRRQNYVDVEDAADMCLQAMCSPVNFLSLGVSARSYSNRQVAELLAQLTGASVVCEGHDNSPSYDYASPTPDWLAPARIALPETLKRMLEI